MYCLTVLDAIRSRSSCWQVWFPWGFTPWLVDGHLLPVCSCVSSVHIHSWWSFVCPNSLLLQGHCHIDLRSICYHLNWITALKVQFPNIVILWHTGDLGFNIWILRDHNSAYNGVILECQSANPMMTSRYCRCHLWTSLWYQPKPRCVLVTLIIDFSELLFLALVVVFPGLLSRASLYPCFPTSSLALHTSCMWSGSDSL